MHPVAIVATNATNVALSVLLIQLALDSLPQISFIGMQLLETLRPSGPDRPRDQRVAIGAWLGDQEITQFFPPTSSGMRRGNQLVAVSTAVLVGGRVI
jgi:hypothetical protein